MTPPSRSSKPDGDLRPDSFLPLFRRDVKSPDKWPAWILIRWEDSFLLRDFLHKFWDVLQAPDISAERVVLHVRDAASARQLYEEIAAPSLFSSTRLIAAHIARPLKRSISLDALSTQLSAIPDRTIVVMALEGMAKLDEEAAALSKAAPASAGVRRGVRMSIWHPYDRAKYMSIAQESILVPAAMRCSVETLQFWLYRLGSNLDRLESEARRMKIQFPDGQVTVERLEQVFEVPHIHEETIWRAVEAALTGDISAAAPALEVLLQSMDVNAATAEMTYILTGMNELIRAADTPAAREEIFRRLNIRGKRTQTRLTALVLRLRTPIPHLADRLLKLDLAVKQTRSTAGRQEVFLRTFLSLCGEPEPAV